MLRRCAAACRFTRVDGRSETPVPSDRVQHLCRRVMCVSDLSFHNTLSPILTEDTKAERHKSVKHGVYDNSVAIYTRNV
jgi:hypothetical protein